jgi:hypothetical protein
MQSAAASQFKIFWQPQGITLIISTITLMISEKKVRTAQAIPTFPILAAIASNFCCKSVGSWSPY